MYDMRSIVNKSQDIGTCLTNYARENHSGKDNLFFVLQNRMNRAGFQKHDIRMDIIITIIIPMLKS